jgi:hypothetical protein
VKGDGVNKPKGFLSADTNIQPRSRTICHNG